MAGSPRPSSLVLKCLLPLFTHLPSPFLHLLHGLMSCSQYPGPYGQGQGSKQTKPKSNKTKNPQHPSKLISLSCITPPPHVLIYSCIGRHLQESLLLPFVWTPGIELKLSAGWHRLLGPEPSTHQLLAQNYWHTSPISGCRFLPYIQCLLHSTVRVAGVFRE